ncbi:MAG: EAL domain-containing protein [Gemmatimonadota bacterium]
MTGLANDPDRGPIELLEQLGIPALQLDGDGRVVAASAEAARLLAPPGGPLQGELLEELAGVRLTAAGSGQEYLVNTTEGPRWLRFDTAVRNGLRPPSLVVVVRDVTETYRRRELEDALQDLDEGLLEGMPPERILAEACTRAARLYDIPLVWIGSREADGHVRARARAGRMAHALDALMDCWDPGVHPAGPVARAFRERIPQRADVLAGEEPPTCRTAMAEHRLRFITVIPLVVGGECRGVLVAAIGDGPLGGEAERGLAALATRVCLVLSHGLRHALQQLQDAALRALPAAVYIMDPQGRIVWANEQLQELSGYADDELVGMHARTLKAGVERAETLRSVWHQLREGGRWGGELHNRRNDGTVYLAAETLRAVRDGSGRITHFVGTQVDLTRREDEQRRARKLAEFDALTGLPNRRHLERRLERCLSSDDVRAAAVMILDLDHFSLINDMLGHAAGDDVLVEVGELFRKVLGEGPFLARWSGDEFAVFLEGCTLKKAVSVAENLQRAVSDFRVELDGHDLTLGATVGVAAVKPGDDAGRALAAADTALYRARTAGPGKLSVAPDAAAARPSGLRDGYWATLIRDAMRGGHLRLHFQPVVRLEDETTVHYEALLRMVGTDGSLITPDRFIPAAERFGIMPELDLWVLRQAVDVLKRDPAVNLFINISGAGLGDPTHLERIERLLEDSGLAPGRLTLELTETAALQDPDAAARWMRRLRELGCGFALDDFGKGFSTFSYLADLPVDFVKIDGSFVRNLDSDRRNRALVKAISSVARTLNKQVIAECVEEPEVARVLRALGVGFGQGYLWGRPVANVPDA